MPLKIVGSTEDSVKHELDITALVFHNNKLYSASDDGKIKLWDENLKLIAEAQAHPCSVFSITAGDDLLYSCSNDGSVKSWTLNDLTERELILQEQNEMWKVCFNQGKLYVGDDAGQIKIFEKGRIIGILDIMHPITELLALNNLVYTARDLYVIISEINPSEKKIATLKAIEGRAPLCVVDDKLCFPSRSGRDIFIQLNSKETDFDTVGMIPDAHEMIINALCGTVVNNETYLFTAGWDKTLKKWKIVKNNTPAEMVDSCNMEICVNTIAANPSGSTLYVGAGNGMIFKVEV